MPASPITQNDIYSDDKNFCQILQPTSEYSKLLQCSFRVQQRLCAFKAKFANVKVIDVDTTVSITNTSVLVVNSAALEISIVKNLEKTTLQVDFHEQWRQHLTGNLSCPLSIEVTFSANDFKTFTIAKSGTYTFDNNNKVNGHTQVCDSSRKCSAACSECKNAKAARKTTAIA